MYQLSVSQIHFKSLIQTQLMQVSFQSADKREPLRIQTNQKIIKFSPPWQQTFDITKYLLVYVEIQDEETGLIKVIGFAKLDIQEILGKEGIYRIDLENGNQVSLFLKCLNIQDSTINSISMQTQLQWAKSLRTESFTQTKRPGSPQRNNIKANTQHLQNSQNVKLSIQSIPILAESRLSVGKGRDSYQSNCTYSGYFEKNKQNQAQQTDPIDNNKQYKQMMKELSLLLEVPQECDSIVYAVQKLLQKFRKQTEQFIKLQCDHQILTSMYTNLQYQKNNVETNSEDFKTSIKQKLKNYKTLFEENVQLKNTLKEDLTKIVELNLKIKELQKDETVVSEINSLNQQIKLINQNVQQSQQDFAVLVEEINIFSQ